MSEPDFKPYTYSLREEQWRWLTERGAEHDPPNASLALREILKREMARKKREEAESDGSSNAG